MPYSMPACDPLNTLHDTVAITSNMRLSRGLGSEHVLMMWQVKAVSTASLHGLAEHTVWLAPVCSKLRMD